MDGYLIENKLNGNGIRKYDRKYMVTLGNRMEKHMEIVERYQRIEEEKIHQNTFNLLML